MATQQPEKPRRRKKQTRFGTTLAGLLHAMQGAKLTLELRNDVSITGTLASVDEHMK